MAHLSHRPNGEERAGLFAGGGGGGSDGWMPGSTTTGKRLVIVSKLDEEKASQGLTVTEQLWQAKRAVSN